MTVGDVINSLKAFPTDAPVQVTVLSWNPKLAHPVQAVIDLNGAQTPENPNLIIFAGPTDFNSYDGSGYGSLESVQYQYA
jgi:hypothetical protein